MHASSVALPLPRARAISKLRRPELAGLVLLASLLNGWALSRNGVANEYYAAAVKAMASDWHAFLYGSFDASNVMTVDKPPLALWVQALSARVFGFSSWSLLVPQALMGVGTVWLTYDLVARRFGRAAGTVGGLVLALTPITVAISRHNNPDALLILCSVAALWATVRALESGRTRWLVWAGVFVGLGFETKMAAALMVVPGIAAAYLRIAPRGRWAAVGQLAAGGLAVTVVGLAWPVLMWLTPAASRPWISGTADNSIWSLILGYNGLGRLFGQSGTPGGGFGGGGSMFGGDTGAFRLLNASLGPQAGWFLGFALVALIGLAVRRRREEAGWLIAVGGAFVVTAVAFSRAQGIFHPYYVSLLAPFAAALAGAGWTLGRRWLAGALVVGAVGEWQVLAAVDTDAAWLAPMIVAATLAAAVFVTFDLWRRPAAIAAVTVLLAVPASWSVATLGHATSGTFPAGGSSTAAMSGGMFGGTSSALTEAVAYAADHGGVIGVASQSTAASITLSDGTTAVVGLGGFSGSESDMTVAWLAEAVAAGKVRYVLVTDTQNGGMQDGRTGAKTVLAAAAKVGRKTSVSGLYDLEGKSAVLARLASSSGSTSKA